MCYTIKYVGIASYNLKNSSYRYMKYCGRIFILYTGYGHLRRNFALFASLLYT